MFSKIYTKALMIIIIIMILYTVSIIFFISPKVKKNAMELEKRSGYAQLGKISLVVKNTATELESYKKEALLTRKSEIKNITKIALAIAQNYYKKYQNNKLSLKEAKKQAIDNISKIRYNNNDYVFVVNKNYITISHPLKRIIGKSMAGFKDKFGNFVVKPMVDDAFSKGEGFNKYWWPRAKGGQVYEKLSYSTAFKPWNWMIGTGVYIDDISAQAKKKKKQLVSNLRTILKNIKIGKTGYLYIFNGDGKMIIHPNRDIEGDIFKTLKNPVTKHLIYKELIDAYKNNNGVLKYKWDNPRDRKNYIYDKISWIDYNQYFNWYIGSSAYIDEINAQSNSMRNYIITTSLILLFIGLIISFILFRKLLKPISDLTESSIKVQDGDFSVRSNFIGNDEIGILGNNFNKMLDTIEYHIENLEDDYNNKMTETSFKDYINDTKNLNKSIIINLQKASELVKSFKQVAVDQASDENREFYFKKYVEEILSSLRNELKKTNHQIILNIDDSLVIDSNPGAFSQIFTNFIMNSIIHGLDKKTDGIIQFDVTLSKNILHIVYMDNGKGLDPTTKKKIFDPFYTTNRINGGSGLGMNIVFNLVTKKLNGTIKINENKGIDEGVEFIIDIPQK